MLPIYRMTELDVPEDADTQEARELVREFLSVGDEIEIYDTVMMTGEQNRLEGTVAGIEEEFVELEDATESPATERIGYGDIDRVAIVEER